MLSVDSAGAPLPAFSLRFERGRAHLVLSRPFELSVEGRRGADRTIGRLIELDLDLGPQRGGVRLQGGWTSVRTFRSAVASASLELDPAVLAQLGGVTLTLEGALPTGRGARLSWRDGRRTTAMDVHPRWRDGDLLLALRNVRSTDRRGPSALADAIELLASAGAVLDATSGVVVVPRPLRRLLAEALLPLGMRVPSTDGVLQAPWAVTLDERGRALLRLAAGPGAPAAGAQPSESTDRVHAEARILAEVTVAITQGDLEAARHALSRVSDRLQPATHEELRAACALESPDLEADSLRELAGEGVLPALARARRAAGASGRDELERSIRGWLEVEPSDWLASALLVRMAEDVRREDGHRARWLARQAATRLARLVGLAEADPHASETSLAALARRAVELAEGELSRDTFVELLPLLGLEPGAERDEATSPALALALDAVGRTSEADAVWQRLRLLDDAGTAALVAARDERRGDQLAALEGWERAAEHSARLGRSADARRAWIRAGTLALALQLAEAASVRLERAFGALEGITPDDTVALVSAIRRGDLVELAGRAEQLLIVAISADGGESAALVGALEELLGWALERHAPSRARALHAALARVRPERADHYLLPEEPSEPEEPRRRAERLRNEGKLAEAAATLAELGKRERDAATLRGALDLAERAGAKDTALDIVDTLLEWIGSGPVADSLRKRRERLTAS